MEQFAYADVSLKTGRWLLVGFVALALVYRNRAALERNDFLREAGLAICAYFAYFLARGVTAGSESQAMANADRVIAVERWTHLDQEGRLQSLIIDHHALVSAANWMYIWGHWPVIAITAVWLVIKHPDTYRLFRNAFMVSGAIGLVVFVLFPVAPPRLAEAGVVDTVTEYSRSYRVLQPPQFVNQYAAVPSLHFGWNLLIGIALATTATRTISRWMALSIPVVMFFAIVMTANHYIIDAVAGGAVALFGLGVATVWARTHAPDDARERQPLRIGARASGAT